MLDDRPVIYLSSDHAGIVLRNTINKHLMDAGYQTQDLGPNGDERVDYPDYGKNWLMPWPMIQQREGL